MFSIDKKTRKINNYLLKRGVKLDLPSSNGTTPLMKAIHMKENQILESLLCKGVSTDSTDLHGINTINYAISRTNKFAVKKLLEHGVKFSLEAYTKGNANKIFAWNEVPREIKLVIAENACF